MNENIKELTNECLNCSHPSCVLACPAHNNIKEFIDLAKQNKIDEAYDVILKTSTLPSICSIVCPFENQCMGHCVKNKINKSVQIPKIEHYIATHAKKKKFINLQNRGKVAIIGSGPSSLACAEILAKENFFIDVYDSFSTPGGILTYGIPDFVLNKDIVNDKINELKKLKVHFIMNKTLGKHITLSQLKTKYDAIYIGIGASIGKKMNIVGEQLNHILDANQFLKDLSLQKKIDYPFKHILIIGGGNTAIDAARYAKKAYNCEVSIIYRRSENEMPARKDEIIKAKEDKINFLFLTNPVKFIGSDKVEEVECIKMSLKEVLNERPVPVEIANSNFKIKADLVIEAISSIVDINCLEDIKTNKWGCIIIDEHMQTSMNKVFAGGDCVKGPSLVVTSMVDGMQAAKNIIQYINFKNNLL